MNPQLSHPLRRNFSPMSPAGPRRRGVIRYGAALIGVLLAVVLRRLLDPVLGEDLTFITLYAAVTFAAWFGGRGPALVAIITGGLAVDYLYFQPHHSFAVVDREFQVGLSVYGLVGLASIYMFESLARARDRAFEQGELLRVTLASIGDGVITTDALGHVTGLNAAAEALTGWSSSEANGQPLDRVFRIVDEGTREDGPNPALRALERCAVGGLANHTILVAKDGREHAIEDSAAPIRNDSGAIIGAVLVFRDVAAQRQSQQAQTETLATLKSLVASAPLGIAILDREMRYVHVNDPLAEMNGVPADEHVGKTLGEIVPDLVPQLGPIISRIFETGQAPPIQLIEGVTSNDPGVRRTWRESWFPITGPSGQLSGAGVIVDEITDEQRAERELAELVQRVTSLVDNTPLAVIEWDADFTVTRWAGHAEKLFGLTADEVVGKGIHDFPFVYEEDLPIVEDTIARLRDPANRFVVRDMRNKTESGAVVTCEWYNSVIHDESGRMVAVLSLVLDVTEQHLQQEQTRRSEARFRQLADAMPHIVWEADPTGRRVYINRQWSVLTGRDTDAGLSDNWMDSVHPEDIDALHAQWTGALAQGVSYTAEYRLLLKDGGHRWMMVRGVPIEGDDGAVLRWYGTSTDIDAQKRLAEALAEADRRKDEFLATLAHELRNPLAPLRNGLELLKRPGYDPRAMANWREMMGRQLVHMVRLVDDLLDVSRISRGKIEVRSAIVELATVIQHAVETSRSMIEEHGHELIVQLPPEPICIDGDVTRLAQVVSNLLNNAAKYTEPEGHIWLTAKRVGGEVIVSVRDDGIGVPPAMLPKLFDIFTQVDQSIERSQGGLGIGLSLVKALVELHGGRVEAKSEGLGKGSEFSVMLPIAQGVQAEECARPEAQAHSRRRILVVDDNRDGADTLARVLTMMGYETRAAYDGVEAVEVAETYRPDVVLLDLGLPKLNGFETCQRLRERAWCKDVTIIAVTGWGQEQVRRNTQEAGFDHHMVKPVDPTALMKLLVEVTPATGATERSS